MQKERIRIMNYVRVQCCRVVSVVDPGGVPDHGRTEIRKENEAPNAERYPRVGCRTDKLSSSVVGSWHFPPCIGKSLVTRGGTKRQCCDFYQ